MSPVPGPLGRDPRLFRLPTARPASYLPPLPGRLGRNGSSTASLFRCLTRALGSFPPGYTAGAGAFFFLAVWLLRRPLDLFVTHTQFGSIFFPTPRPCLYPVQMAIKKTNTKLGNSNGKSDWCHLSPLQQNCVLHACSTILPNWAIVLPSHSRFHRLLQLLQVETAALTRP